MRGAVVVLEAVLKYEKCKNKPIKCWKIKDFSL